MPNRIVREAILTSERVCSLGWPDEVFYRRLMSIVDDYGRHEANPQLLRSRCYPLQTDQVRVADITRWMAACQKAGLVALYEVDGKRYLQIENFGQQQRSASKCPPPPDLDGGCYQLLADAHLDEGVSVVVKPPHPPAGGGPGFEEFWKAWPAHDRKVARKQCAKKWVIEGCEAIADRVIAAVHAAKASDAWTKDNGAFIPAPLVWLNQRRWEAMEVVAEAWHETSGGIKAKGAELGVPYTPDDDCRPFPAYRARVFKAAGFSLEAVA